MRLSCLGLVLMVLAGSTVLLRENEGDPAPSSMPARLAIYYGYPSLVNGAKGDVERAASVFREYDAVVLGDGLEFADKQAGRYPPGDPEEHQKTALIIAAARDRSTGTRFYGYVCLGDIARPRGEKISLNPTELEERIRLWKKMGVEGIFLDEAGYDFPIVTRKRQNLAVGMIRKLGLSAFMNAYFFDDLFSREDRPPHANGTGKNPEHLPPLLGRRDLFLLESFQVRNGDYERAAEWQARVNQALEYRRRYGTQIFATTTTSALQPFSAQKFNYAWWTAVLYGLDGFGWGQPSFAAVNNTLSDYRCSLESTALRFERGSSVGSDERYFWRKAGSHFVVGDTDTHSIHLVPGHGAAEVKEIGTLLSSTHGESLLACGGGT